VAGSFAEALLKRWSRVISSPIIIGLFDTSVDRFSRVTNQGRFFHAIRCGIKELYARGIIVIPHRVALLLLGKAICSS
jgi:hypothetical protein